MLLSYKHNGWPNGCSFFSLKGTTVWPTIVLEIVPKFNSFSEREKNTVSQRYKSLAIPHDDKRREVFFYICRGVFSVIKPE